MLRPQLKNLVAYIQEMYQCEAFLPLHEPRFNEREKELVMDCIDSTFVSSVGPYVDQFEKQIADYTGAKYAIATVNGTAALHVSLLLAGVERGSEVITQALSFIATCNAISYCGASPVFVDVDKQTLGLSAESLSDFLSQYAFVKDEQCFNKHTQNRISACVPMHTFGHPCEIDRIKAICEKWCIPLVEDAAESLGSVYQNQHTGTFGLLGAISFNGNKIITAGGGGAIITQDEQLAKKARHLTTTAKVPHKWAFNHDQIGYNYRMPNLNAALLCAQLEKLEVYIQNKRETAQKYQAWCQSNQVAFVSEPPNAASNFWLNAILLKDQAEQQNFLEYANNQGVMTRPAWTLLNTLPMFKDCLAMPQNNAQYLSEHLVNLPSSVR
ncbi:LegC family aminotransferase [Hydrogenovibrio halophilus]|uniref:LegC family aminotransferase n=1 Tax=Hydrogenovibrio halophilus TaxID=373391 RepID=UPI0003731721|nr:LegC family aminotransferase [Hydrogenovibrio halophilus]